MIEDLAVGLALVGGVAERAVLPEAAPVTPAVTGELDLSGRVRARARGGAHDRRDERDDDHENAQVGPHWVQRVPGVTWRNRASALPFTA